MIPLLSSSMPHIFKKGFGMLPDIYCWSTLWPYTEWHFIRLQYGVRSASPESRGSMKVDFWFQKQLCLSWFWCWFFEVLRPLWLSSLGGYVRARIFLHFHHVSSRGHEVESRTCATLRSLLVCVLCSSRVCLKPAGLVDVLRVIWEGPRWFGFCVSFTQAC